MSNCKSLSCNARSGWWGCGNTCGNGTCARAALLYAKELLKLGDSFEQYSVLRPIELAIGE